MIGRYLTVELTGTTGSTFTGAVVEAPRQTRASLPMAGATEPARSGALA